MGNIASNIKILREEARLSKKEFAEKAGVSIETVNAWEEGTLTPLTKEMMVICPILKISEEDIVERDILSEREEANKRLKQSALRSNYNWYYGSRRKIFFYLSFVILIPLIFCIGYFILKYNNYFINNNKMIINSYLEAGYKYEEISFKIRSYYIWYPIQICSAITIVYIIIELVLRFNFQFHFYYILIAIFVIGAIMFAGIVLLVPYYIYSLYQLIIKRGRN